MNIHSNDGTASFYQSTNFEHVANVITHGLFILPSLLGLVFLIQLASNHHQFLNALLYGFALVALFSVSTTYHCVCYVGTCKRLRDFLHRCDRACIYFFIAASYTPWLTLRDMTPSCWFLHVRWLVWLLAFLGILYQQLYHEKYKWLETAIYIVVGLFPSVVVIHMPVCPGLRELLLGGLSFLVGVVFFKSDGRIPCAHAVWHLFVGLGAMLHYYAVCKYLMGKHNEGQVFTELWIEHYVMLSMSVTYLF